MEESSPPRGLAYYSVGVGHTSPGVIPPIALARNVWTPFCCSASWPDLEFRKTSNFANLFYNCSLYPLALAYTIYTLLLLCFNEMRILGYVEVW